LTFITDSSIDNRNKKQKLKLGIDVVVVPEKVDSCSLMNMGYEEIGFIGFKAYCVG
jgi:hypothetical protein